ncbi:hypothetical protein TraAM80_01094 [Trypanosoma rangeli]|uniref:Uncharacterized protein n=1 Tax=Trypanosoma rangeli TaxID=5698 RepID=A0A422P087_TRYRA|nr:uncharacterized protein TraAM80_01094 [Trypanosoma rangeli]RNF11127.1 hypothetical protein TraAM80_01094 [Trypanosoma rangeli]|eukprot:RNF11127.1 hypothetical protein TraAM80_01094 [Trypanosoma rangeli]
MTPSVRIPLPVIHPTASTPLGSVWTLTPLPTPQLVTRCVRPTLGPEWAIFTTVARMSVKKTQEQETHGVDSASSVRGVDGTTLRPLTAEELHSRELRARRRRLEKKNMRRIKTMW